MVKHGLDWTSKTWTGLISKTWTGLISKTWTGLKRVRLQPRTQALWFTTPLRGSARGDARGRNTEFPSNYPRAPRNGHAASLRQPKAPGQRLKSIGISYGTNVKYKIVLSLI